MQTVISTQGFHSRELLKQAIKTPTENETTTFDKGKSRAGTLLRVDLVSHTIQHQLEIKYLSSTHDIIQYVAHLSFQSASLLMFCMSVWAGH